MDYKITNQNELEFFFHECNRRYKEGKAYKGGFTEKRASKSWKQCKLYFTYINCIMMSQGYLKHECKNHKDRYHDEIKKIILGTKKIKVLGKEVETIPSIKDFNTKEMWQYMENVRMEMEINWDIKLPDPNDRFIDEFIKKYGELE